MTKAVLLADDSPTIRRVVELSFADSGLRLETVATGGEALARLDSLRPDLVLADVDMPEPAGYELCRRIKESARPVPVLLLAGAFEGFDAERTRACGADGGLTKPFDTRRLVQQVHDLLKRDEARARLDWTGIVPAPGSDTERAPAAVEDDRRSMASQSLDPPPSSAGAQTLPIETIEAIARAVAERMVGPLAEELARELAKRAAEPDDPA